MSWPNDADGDVLRRLQESGFNFEQEQEIEFMVDFDSWPPPEGAIDTLQKEYGNTEVYPPEDDLEGYLLFKIKSILTYELVINAQNQASKITKKYGGICEAWGVLQS